MIYLFIFCYLLICVILYDVYEKKSYLKTNYIILFLFFTFIAGLRWRLGVDTVNYMYSFQYDIVPLSQLSIKDILESQFQPFWVLLNSFCKSYGNFTLLQILVSMFFHASVFYFLYRSCTKPFTVLAIYYLYNYFYFSMEIMRESLAVACFLYGVLFLDKENVVKYYVLSVCAFMFHFFAVFCFFIPLILSNYCSLKRKVLVSVVIIGLWFMFKIEILTYVVGFMPLFVGEKLINYFIVDRYGSNVWRITGFIFHLFPLLLIVVYCYLYFCKKCRSTFKIKDSLWSSLVVTYFILLILSTNMSILLRFTNYMYMVVAILYVSCIYVIRFKKNSQAIFVLICFFLMFGLRSYMLSREETTIADYKLRIHQYAQYYPYTSVFDKDEPLERSILHSYWGDNK